MNIPSKFHVIAIREHDTEFIDNLQRIGTETGIYRYINDRSI